MTVKAKNISKRLGSLSLVLLMSMLLTVVTWAQSLDKGIYTISNNVSHDNPVGQGMARSYTEATSDVEVNDKGIYVSLGFNNTQYMGDFLISVDGSKVSYETTDLGNNMKELTFKVPGLSSSIKVGLYVTAMDTNVEYTVTLDESSLKLVKKTEVEKETTPAPATQTEKPASSTSNGAATKPAEAKPVQAEQAQPAKPALAAKEEASKETVKAETSKKVGAENVEGKVTEIASVADEAASQTKAQSEGTKAQSEVTEEVVGESAESTQAQVATNTETSEEADKEADKEANKEVAEEVFNEVEEMAAEETEVAQAESNSMTMILVVCGIVIIGAIGAVIYFKKK